MRKTFLAITLFLAFSKAALAQFGNCTASEMRTYVDSATGNTITMLTDTMKNDRFLYQTDPMWTADGKYLLFRSSSRGNDKEVESTLPNGEKRKWTPTQIYLLKWPPVRLFKLRKDRTWAVLFWLIKRIVCLSAGKKKKTGTCM